MQFQWHDLCENKYRYQTCAFADTNLGKRFNRLYHEHMMISVAGYGGPIAITSDKMKLLTLRNDDPSLENVCIFSNEGELINRIKLDDPFRNIIVMMQFTQDELLLVVFQQGKQWLIDPYSAEVREMSLVGLLERENVLQGKVFENGYAILTSYPRFLFVRNCEQPQCVQFVSCQQELKEQLDRNPNQHLFWRVFAPNNIISEKVQLHLVHPLAGIVQVVEGEGKRYLICDFRYFFNHDKAGHVVEAKLPHIKAIKYISDLSPNKKLIAYFSAEPLYKESPIEQTFKKKKDEKGKGDKDAAKEPVREPYGYAYRLIVAPSINSDSIESNKFKSIDLPFVRDGVHLNTKDKLQKLQVKWCGSKALIVQFQNHELYLFSVEGDFVRIEKGREDKDKWSYLKEEVDGTRIITRNENKIIRQIPIAYVHVFESFSEQPGNLLYAAYNAFEDQEPLQDDQIRKDKDRLAKGVDECIISSRFQLKFDVVRKLLKAATYGKAFLPPNMLANNSIYEAAKALRIVHHLRLQLRYITLDQFFALGDDHLLKILLRNRQHYLAFEIYNYLRKDQSFRVKIFTDWACCKVQSREQSEDTICQEIRRKLEDEKGVSFTQIAHKSIEIGRSELAMKLLQFEPSLSKKVPLLLWIGNRENLESCHKFYEKGVEDALKSQDLNLLLLAIKKILVSEKLSDFEVFELFSKNKEGVYALINYYRMFNPSSLVKYYNYLHNPEAIIMEYIRMAFADRKYENMQKLLFAAGEQLKALESGLQIEWRKDIFRRMFQHLCQFTKHNPNVKYVSQKIKPVTLGKQLQVLILKQDSDGVQDMKNQHKISDKRVVMAKVKVLIDTGKWEDLLAFVEKHQKNLKIPVELIANLLLQRKEGMWAMKMIARMPTKQKDEQYLLLQRIGCVKEAIDLAADRKDIDTLEDIANTLVSQELKTYLNEKLAVLRRR